ncbi:uncharacterized protein CC84DRAFT_1160335 [Paraphaeosphaeria sporulosa]|uniref:Uncharacterized protein n=1 Tax=Paraphaeosphaeria sporulosa TaxID=1460663 RepID=A0A177D085_9PLEO|nr:uncharacterized protein CC84DRAFT_1160335 [Paraphaeosphaeria sporulosa]OAG13114.1 hypothetical protein CC84DRAFT_1160335 [Paraphaeosphaeria sporulosa]
MRYQELEEARAKRETKDQAAAAKGKRDRKHIETEEDAGSSVPKSNAVVPKGTQLANTREVSWRAPVAKMY